MDKETKHLLARITRILFEEDPRGVRCKDAYDEYEFAANEITKRLGTCTDSAHLKRIILQEFRLGFSDSLTRPLEHYETSAQRIWQVWNECSPELVEQVKKLPTWPVSSKLPLYGHHTLRSHTLTVVVVWAAWNGIDFSMGDNLLEMLDLFDSSFQLKQMSFDDRDNFAFLKENRVLNIPALLLVKEGKVLDLSIGYKQTTQLRQLLTTWKETHA